jgi:hypothetical protein
MRKYVFPALLILNSITYAELTPERIMRHEEKVLSAQKEEALKAEKEKKELTKKSREKILAERIYILENPITYDYGWDSDDSNFSEKPSPFTGVANEWIVLANTHIEDELHLGDAVSGRFVPGKHRSLKWAVPYQLIAPCMKNVEDIHNSLALPLEWSSKKHRAFVTFILVPKNASLTYKIGIASEQKENAGKVRYGGGVQMRLQGLPVGTILLTEPIYDEQKKDLSATKGEKKVNFQEKLLEAIKNFNAKKGPGMEELPLTLVDISNDQCRSYEWIYGLFTKPETDQDDNQAKQDENQEN